MDETVKWIEGRFAASTAERDPFPYLIVSNILPDRLYREMRACSPSTPEWRIVQRLDARREPMIAIRPGRTTPLLRWRENRWTRFREILDKIDELTIRAFSHRIDKYCAQLRDAGFIDDVPKIGGGQSLFCQRHPLWKIAPHTHSLDQIVQSMIYFPLPNSPPSLGTVFYRLKRTDMSVRRHALRATHSFDPSDVEEAFRAPYRENTLVAFMNTPRSIHGTDHTYGRMPRRYIFTGSSMDDGAMEFGDGDVPLSAFV